MNLFKKIKVQTSFFFFLITVIFIALLHQLSKTNFFIVYQSQGAGDANSH